MKANRLEAISVARRIREAGYEAYFAGGCVRDTIIGAEPNDWDITTNATPDQVEAIFGSDALPVGKQFGVIWVKPGVEVATYRTDGNYTDNRRPDSVQFSKNVEEDVKRRDFTINALLMDTSTPDMQIIDYVGGKLDLEAGLLRTVGNPYERFQEDALRLMRAVRFACRFSLMIDSRTWAAMHDESYRIQHVSRERIADELKKIILTRDSARGFEMLAQVGLLHHVMPEAEGFGTRAFTCELLNRAPRIRSGGLMMAAVLYPLGLVARQRVFKRLKASNDFFQAVYFILDSQELLERLPRASQSEIYNWLKHAGMRGLDDALKFYGMMDNSDPGRLNESEIRDMLAERISKFRNVPNYSGDWLRDRFQIAQGPWVGLMLASLLEEGVEGRINNEGDAILFMMHQLATGGFGEYKTTGDVKAGAELNPDKVEHAH